MNIFNNSAKIINSILCLMLIAPLSNIKADEYDPNSYLGNSKIIGEVRKLESNMMARKVFEDNKNSFGVTNDILSFINGLSGGQYSTQIQIIQSVPTQKWNMNMGGGWGAYEIKNVKKLVNSNVQVNTTSRIAAAGTNIMYGLGALSIAIDIWDGINGDNGAKLKAIAGTESVVKSYLINTYGRRGMGIAMASTAILGYTINKFYSTVLGSYSGYWWEGYSGYLNAKYRLVKGGNSWVNVAKSGGESAIPVNSKAATAARIEFEQKVLKKSASQIKAYWSKRVFSGKGKPPKEVDNDAAVIAFVAANAGAIGYVDAASVDASVNVLKTF